MGFLLLSHATDSLRSVNNFIHTTTHTLSTTYLSIGQVYIGQVYIDHYKLTEAMAVFQNGSREVYGMYNYTSTCTLKLLLIAATNFSKKSHNR